MNDIDRIFQDMRDMKQKIIALENTVCDLIKQIEQLRGKIDE